MASPTRNTITLVTGDPRSGTSLMMAVLRMMGVRVAGERWPAHRGADDPSARRRAERARRLNPRGFYEIPGVVSRGFPGGVPGDLAGEAVKVIFPGAWPRHSQRGTPAECVDRGIVCLRRPGRIAESQRSLGHGVEAAGASGGWEQPKPPASLAGYVRRAGAFAGWLADQPAEVRRRWLPVDHDELIAEPLLTVRQVADHLELGAPERAVRAAARLVDPSLRRSGAASAGRGDPDAACADLVYRALRSMRPGAMRLAAERAAERNAERLALAVRWVDAPPPHGHGTWDTCIPEHGRMLAANTNGVRDAKLARLAAKRRSRLIPDQCPHFGLSPSETYTIDRPPDLGPITRPRVACSRDGADYTIERCKACWLAGSTVGGERLGAEREHHFVEAREKVDERGATWR